MFSLTCCVVLCIKMECWRVEMEARKKFGGAFEENMNDLAVQVNRLGMKRATEILQGVVGDGDGLSTDAAASPYERVTNAMGAITLSEEEGNRIIEFVKGAIHAGYASGS